MFQKLLPQRARPAIGLVPGRWPGPACFAVLNVLAAAGFAKAQALGPAPPPSASADHLRSQYETLAPQMAKSPFQRPLVLFSGSSSAEPSGDVYAVVEHPFRNLSTALRRAEDWCGILILPSNVKRCALAGSAPRQHIELAVGRKFDQPVSQAYAIDFEFSVQATRADHLLVEMRAENGPLGTRSYRLTLEAVPLGATRSFVHMSYAYANGFAARVATDAYLATVGRDKVGFSITGRDADGQPVYVRGIRGVAERNTMRYFLAIESFLDSQAVPPSQRLEIRLRDWFEATERYPRQLHEIKWDDYIAMKRRDARTQLAANPAASLP